MNGPDAQNLPHASTPALATINAFTVDLEEWFHGLTSTNPLVSQWSSFGNRVEVMTQTVLRILANHHVRATFFVLGCVAEQHPQLVEAICSAGHEIGTHGHTHRFVSRLERDEFACEIERSLAAIMQVTGKAPMGHRAPYFSVNANTSWAFDVLKQFGICYDSSVFPTRNMLYGYPGAPRFPYRLPNTNLVEFPLSTLRKAGINWPMSGGFYLRILPYPLVRRAIRRLNAQGQPAILYLHPWELDRNQPAYPVTPRERLTHFGGRKTLAHKLEQLLDDFDFEPLENHVKNY